MQHPASDVMGTLVPGSEEGALEVIGRSLLLLGQSPRKSPHSALPLPVKMQSFVLTLGNRSYRLQLLCEP